MKYTLKEIDDIMRNAFDTLDGRVSIKQVAGDNLRDVLAEPVTCYAGFDPTGPSLHVGHLLVINALLHLSQHGHQAIALVGEATALLGDPSDKDKERPRLTKEVVKANAKSITAQLDRLLVGNEGEGVVQIVNNADWSFNWSYVDFLHELGSYFRLSEMLAKDAIKRRLNCSTDDKAEGMPLNEFCYMTLQAHDFLYLYKNFGVKIQWGGSDQWGNIIFGINLVRKRLGKTVYGITLPLLTSASGKRFGTTGDSSETIWLDATLTSPYQFYQFWVRTTDRDVIRYLRYFTFLPLDEISGLETKVEKKPGNREAQKRLAYEVTKQVHGEDEACRVQKTSELFFTGELDQLTDADWEMVCSDIPTTTCCRQRLENGFSVVAAFAESGLCKNKLDAVDLIQKGGAYVNNVRVTDSDTMLSKHNLISDKMIVLRKGRKTFHLFRVV
jgi:tyrosyl-tRNA synthetase